MRFEVPNAASTNAKTERRSLRIAMVAPPWFELPPRGYGGIETVVADLVQALTGRGHHITLIGAGRHRTSAQSFLRVFEEPPSERLGTPAPEVIHAAGVAALLQDIPVDVVHDHTLAGPLLARSRPVPTVVTMHGPVDGEQGEYYGWLGDSVEVVAISEAQRRMNPRLNWVGRVHNAVDVASFPFEAVKDDYVLWLGRFNHEKAPHLAIDAARAVGLPIVLAGKCNEPPEKAFFEAEIRPRLGPGVEFVGEADAAFKRTLLARARCLAFPVQWDEPFGMVMIEAMACGTPVVALPRGSVREVVSHGESGLIAPDLQAFPDALMAATDLDPIRCRQYAERHFDLTVMADGYEAIYGSLIHSERILPAHDTVVDDFAVTGSGSTVRSTRRRPSTPQPASSDSVAETACSHGCDAAQSCPHVVTTFQRRSHEGATVSLRRSDD